MKIRYTLDGTTPARTNGYVYCGAISVRPRNDREGYCLQERHGRQHGSNGENVRRNGAVMDCRWGSSGNFHIQNINSFHSRLEDWMRPFNGVATRPTSPTFKFRRGNPLWMPGYKIRTDFSLLAAFSKVTIVSAAPSYAP